MELKIPTRSLIKLSLCCACMLGTALAQTVPLPQTEPSKPPQPAPAQTKPATSDAQKDGAQPSVQPDPELRIGNGDLLTVKVYGAPEFDNDVRVSSTGEISLPLIGNLKVAGLSILDAQALIRNKLVAGAYFHDPQVSVFAKEYSTQGVSVLGEVQKPGVYPLLGSRTLYDAISTAGGVTERAGSVVSITHRDHPDSPETVNFLKHASNDPKSGATRIFPGDTVVVSRAGVVYVVGDVKLPSGIILDKANMTVLQALAMAQGANPTASLSSARLIRTSNETRHEIPLDLKRILAAKAPDPRVQEDDIIFVPMNVGKVAAKNSLDAIVRLATAVIIHY
jgi:polysaccharide export outer membrane protein